MVKEIILKLYSMRIFKKIQTSEHISGMETIYVHYIDNEMKCTYHLFQINFVNHINGNL